MEARRAYIAEDRVRFPSRLPAWSDRLRELWYKRYPSANPNGVNGSIKRVSTTTKRGICKHCGKDFEYRSSRIYKYCSTQCANAGLMRFDASTDEILTKLRELGSYTKVGEYFGVSANAVKKRCKKLGLLDESTKLVRITMSNNARQRCLDNPEQIKKANRESASMRKKTVPYFVATSAASGEELYRFSTYAELRSAGFSSDMVLRACSGVRKTYRGMRWHRESK